MRAVKAQHRFIQPSIAGIPIVHEEVPIVIAERPAPRVRRLRREALRQAFRHLDFQRVIRRTAPASIQHDTIELRIEYEEILREQSAVSDETAASVRDVPAAVQEVRKLADTAVCNERTRRRVGPQRGRSRNRCAIDHSRSRDIYAA